MVVGGEGGCGDMKEERIITVTRGEGMVTKGRGLAMEGTSPFTHLTSSTKAITPAAMGAAADVPLKLLVQ